MTKTTIADATMSAIREVRESRFFASERGYHGRFYCALQGGLDRLGLLTNHNILEMEYQKSSRVHRTNQRPDIILHAPAEVTGASRTRNNHAVWALKRRASPSDAAEDFRKLDDMIDCLHFKVIVFLNVDDSRSHFSVYSGNHKDRLVTAAVKKTRGCLQIVLETVAGLQSYDA